MRTPHRRHHSQVRFGRTAIVLQLITAVAFLVYLLSHEGVSLPFLSNSSYTIRAEMTDAGGLNPSIGAPVLVAGVPEGSIQSISYHDGLTLLRLQLPGSIAPLIHRNASLDVVPRSALEDLTVEISPGSRSEPALPAGGLIPPTRTSASVRFDRLVDVLDGSTRAELQVMLAQLQLSLDGREGAWRGDLQELGDLVNPATAVTSQLAERQVLLSRLVTSLDSMVTTLGRRQDDLAGAVDAGQRTLSVTAARSAQIAEIMRSLPGALSELQGAMSAVRRLSGPLEPALTGLMPFARALPGALAALRTFDPHGLQLVGDLGDLIKRGSTPAADLQRVFAALGPAAQRLRPTISDLHPVLQDINVHKDGIGQLGDNFSGVFSTNDANGPILRGLGFFERFNPADVGFSSSAATTAAADSVRALTRVCLHTNPLACIVRYLIPGLPGAVVPLSQAREIAGAGG
ncbi:MAG TPA: MlaD family protein [Solirubrobacteraceae bacterium]|nr:MlaD family protein [Solirubrobacteraceae bacterium]